MTHKTYTGPLVDVNYDREICRHAAECVRGMPTVFDVAKRPWINPEHAATDDDANLLRYIVGLCPSGALEIQEHVEGPGQKANGA